jgi:FkbM family methyltransferase
MSLMTLPAVVFARNILRRTGLVKTIQPFRPTGGYEETVGIALEKCLRAGDVAWDVGANAGLYTKILAATAGPAGNVFAFEPSPQNLTHLRAACATLPNVTVLPVGLSSNPGRAKFIQGDDDLGATSRIAGSGEINAGETIEVELSRGDDLVGTGTAMVPNLIKIDVEGHEYEVLEGLSGTLDRIFEGCEALGHYFHDHISFLAANICADRPALLNRLAGFRFCGNTMRSLRFELSPQAQAQGRTGSGYAHISFRTDGSSGFDALRETLRSLQKDGHLNFMAATQVLKDFPYLTKAAYWRFGRQQLLWPPKALHELHIVTEQLPRASSRIALASETDALGCPMAMIDWQVEAFDCNAVRLFAQRFDSFWKRRGLDRMGRLEWAMNLDTYEPCVEKNAADTYHPGGTTRMGDAPRSSVVDRNLSVFAVSNLSVASTSTFPSGPSANPTMMLMLFTLRLADHLSAQFGTG